MSTDTYSPEDAAAEVHHTPTPQRGSDRSFVEAQKLGLLGYHEPEGPHAPRTPASISELASALAAHKAKGRAAREQRGRLTNDLRAAKLLKSQLQTAIAEGKEQLAQVVGTDRELQVAEVIARSRAELLPVQDRIDALEAALKASPGGTDQDFSTGQRLHEQLLRAVEKAEVDAFPADALVALHAAYSVGHQSANDWTSWVGQVLQAPDTRSLQELRAAVLQRHGQEV